MRSQNYAFTTLLEKEAFFSCEFEVFVTRQITPKQKVQKHETNGRILINTLNSFALSTSLRQFFLLILFFFTYLFHNLFPENTSAPIEWMKNRKLKR